MTGPPGADEQFALAVAHHQAGRLGRAAALYRLLLAGQPAQSAALHNLGLLDLAGERPAAAVRLFRRAVRVWPPYAEGWSNLGVALRALNLHEEAEYALRRASLLRPDLAQPQNNLAGVCKERGYYDRAITFFRRAVTLQPNNPEIHCNLAAALLQRGDFAEGWREHEWRLHPQAGWANQRDLPQTLWTGQDLAGKRLLLHSEQGLGDDLQFARYAAPLAAMGAEIILEVAAPLTRLLASVPGVTAVVTRDAPLPSVDYRLSSMSAPARLGVMPDQVPYVQADDGLVAVWRERLAGLAGRKVGLVWAGEPRPEDRRAFAIDRQRSMKLSALRPLLELPAIHFISLQKGAAAGQIGELPARLRPHDWMDEVTDFADSAALLSCLDLVISVDSSVVHLAGALAKPVWVLSRFNGCWRWLADREDSYWYPTARLFHQRRAGDWAELVERVAAALCQADQPFAGLP